MTVFAPTKAIDDPFEASIIYTTAVQDSPKSDQVVYANDANCAFVQVSNKSFASSRKRGSKTADSFFEFKLTSLRQKLCSDPLATVDINQARFFGSLAADVDVKIIQENCAALVCKGEYSVSIRLTGGVADINGNIAIKFGAPHADSLVVSVPMKDYLAHRADVFR